MYGDVDVVVVHDRACFVLHKASFALGALVIQMP